MSALNLLVFRDSQRPAGGQELKAALVECLQSLSGECSQDAIIHALLRAGELECAMADADDASVRPLEALTDSIADALLRSQTKSYFDRLAHAARELPVLEQLSLSTPEGFAYYALHPLAYADVLQQISVPKNNLVMVGIRSIGTTLSSAAAAAAR